MSTQYVQRSDLLLYCLTLCLTVCQRTSPQAKRYSSDTGHRRRVHLSWSKLPPAATHFDYQQLGVDRVDVRYHVVLGTQCCAAAYLRWQLG